MPTYNCVDVGPYILLCEECDTSVGWMTFATDETSLLSARFTIRVRQLMYVVALPLSKVSSQLLYIGD